MTSFGSLFYHEVNFDKEKLLLFSYTFSFTGLRIEEELYVPFSFLKKYYEVYGEEVKQDDNNNNNDNNNKEEKFLWLLTAPKDLDPRNIREGRYLPVGKYLNFKDSDVANRARVKCICGKYEVCSIFFLNNLI